MAIPSSHSRDFARSVHVLNPPADAPGAALVLRVALRCAQAYRDKLGDMANDSLNAVVKSIEATAKRLTALPLVPLSPDGLRRRLSRYPTWGLLIETVSSQLPQAVLEGIGAEICTRWHTESHFSRSFATNLRRTISTGEDTSCPDIVAVRQLASAMRRADTIFRRHALGELELDSDEHFRRELTQWFRNRTFFGSNKAQQALLHNRTQSRAQFLASAKWLRQRVETGDALALQACIGALLALRPDLVPRIPLLTATIDPDWLLCLDVTTGCIHFSRALFIEGGAAPPTLAKPGAIIPASVIYVTPLPQFLASVLQQRLIAFPGAKTLGELIPDSQPLESNTRTLAQDARIAPTFAKFRNSLGPIAVREGIDRFITSIIAHDPRLTPTGKFFYAQASRSELWAASDELFDFMAWSPSVSYVSGLSAGSQVTPTEETVRAWFTWIVGMVESLRPATADNQVAVLEFHNAYAKACGSLLSFALALRERKRIPITGSTAVGRGMALALGDKNCGAIPGRRSVPLPRLADQLIADFLAHIAALDDCLEQLGTTADSSVRRRFRQILEGESVPIFSTVTRGRHKFISTDALAKWWPKPMGLVPNFGRHYVQTGLRRQGLRSTYIDAYVRHSLRGIPHSSSARTQSLNDLAAMLGEALNRLFEEVGLHSIAGLAPKAGGSK